MSAPESVLDVVPVMPVVVVDDLAAAVLIARALVAGGLPAIELTLRTPVALDALRAIVAEVPGILVGAGTIVTPQQAAAAAAAGAAGASAAGRSGGSGGSGGARGSGGSGSSSSTAPAKPAAKEATSS